MALLFLTGAATGPAAVAGTEAGATAPLPGAPLAWERFANAGQSYAGRPYLWLGDGDLKCVFDVAPRAGLALDLLWGAKNDRRSARLVINGQPTVVSNGGYDGFRWVRVPVPDGVPGPRCEVTFQTGGDGKPAFLAEVRLVDPARSGPAPGNLAPTSFRASHHRPTPARSEAFPEMRSRWDRATAPPSPQKDARLEARYRQAEANGRRAAEALYRCRRFVAGWLVHADPKTGLIPRNLNRDRDLWNGRDSAADNYPFMVLTCALTDRAMFEGRMLDMLRTETRVTRRLDRLGDHYLFSKQGFAYPEIDLDRLVFDNAEYVKDGLIPLTEWLGPSPWSERMVGLIEDIWKHAAVETPFGKIPTLNFEVNGDLLQAGARLFWFTGRREFLDQAIRLGDYYLLGDHHPTRDRDRLSLLDHGCEVINGLSELYVAVSKVAPEKRRAYREPLHAIYEAVLAYGRDDYGMLHGWIEPKTGAHGGRISDTWGYDYDGLYTLFLVDGVTAYRDAVRHVLGNLQAHYTGFRWQGGSADGYADSIEGAINLYNREPIASAAAWIDRDIRDMWAIQKPDGVIEGWHGDGNFARTSIMYALWKTQGLHVQPWRPDVQPWRPDVQPWRPDVRVGAVRDGDTLLVSLAADRLWKGRLFFDQPRHRVFLHLPFDYPRINQFPEWFTVETDTGYEVRDTTTGTGKAQRHSGRELIAGLPLTLQPGRELRLRIDETRK